jgi:hypothetical protein
MNQNEVESIREAMYEEVKTYRMFYNWVSNAELHNEYLPRFQKKWQNYIKTTSQCDFQQRCWS